MLLIKTLIQFGDFVKNIIYSIYIENDQLNLNEKHLNTKNQLKKHYDRLVKVKEQYAKHCNAEFKIYGNDTFYQKFKNKFQGFEFDLINLYKIHVWEQLSKDYDNVLYLDLDVIPNTTDNFFEVFDMNKICVYAPNAIKENVWNNTMLKNYKKNIHDFEYLMSKIDKYNEYVKAMCKRAMLAITNKFDTDYYIANTAILGANKNAINKLKYTERLNELIITLNLAKKEKFFGNNISKNFFANNEVFFHYLLDKYQISWYNIPREWHTYYMKKDVIDEKVNDIKMIHLINKRFEELWKILDKNETLRR